MTFELYNSVVIISISSFMEIHSYLIDFAG